MKASTFTDKMTTHGLQAYLVTLLCCCSVVDSALTVRYNATALVVTIGDTKVVEHTSETPFLFAGTATADIEEFLGNFEISEYLEERVALTEFSVTEQLPDYFVTFSQGERYHTTVKFGIDGNHENVVEFTATSTNANRYWIRLFAEADEHVYGGGEQFSYFDLRGHDFPLWTREQGVGRNKSTVVTLYANQNDGGGGDYHTTYFPEPTFVSSRKFYCHFDTSVYSVLDFRNPSFHEVEVWTNNPGKMYLDTAPTMLELIQKLSGFLGTMPAMPEWLYKGAVLGIQGGTDAMLGYIDQADKYGIQVSAVWIQDWVGRIKTSFGRRLFWNWEWDKKQYPNLDKVIQTLKARGIGVLAYISPYLNHEGDLFKIADKNGYFVKTPEGNSYVADFGEFYCGTIDFTNPAAYDWYKNEVIKKNMIDLGFSGWMADFGEYLPTKNVVFHSGVAPDVLHNQWPVIWARMNREAVEESGKLGEVLYWMRAGYSGTQKYSTMTWAGDQFVDFSRGDGLPSVIPAALSLSVLGAGLAHFDVGGYTALFGYARSEELLLRSGEMAVFTPMMRTHEGNRPSENWQYYSSDGTLRKFARLTQLHHALADYTKHVVAEHVNQGLPAQRPLFLHYDKDPETYKTDYQYLYGRDLLVAPVLDEAQSSMELYLPDDDWVYLWNNTDIDGGKRVVVDAPLGYPPVFYKKSSSWVDTFKRLTEIKPSRIQADEL
ncbi:sulfoquinovosidase-like isoform X3 [Ptychodera flava]|uniref:sulfoquinovosidase-like isoform X3 n=1 Tax=Ptychodera flava TaxID=63121 RepID=UPI00396A7DC4